MSGQVFNFTGGIGSAGGSGNGNLFADLVQLPAEVDGMSDVNTVVYGNGRIIAPRYGAAEAFYSDDYGTTWKTMALPYAADWEGSTYADGVFLLFGGASSDKIARSTDNGFTWTTVYLPTTFYWLRSMAYGEGKFVAVCPSHDKSLNMTRGSVLYSTDAGATWQVSYAIANIRSSITAYGNGVFVNAPYEAEGSFGLSSDGVTWTDVAFSTAGIRFISSLIFVNGRFYAFPSYTATTTNAPGSNIAAYSEDGKNWTSFTLPTTGHYRQAAYGNGTLFVLSTKDSTKGYYSTDNGATWQSVSMDSQMAMGTGALAFFCESRFIVIGSNAVYYSETGAELSTWMVDKITSLSIDNIDRTRLVAEALAPYLSVGSGSGGSGDDDGGDGGDGGDGDGGDSIVVITDGDVYSTEETVVGTWINGKPIYRTVILATYPTTLDQFGVGADLTSLNIEKLVDIYGVTGGANIFCPGGKDFVISSMYMDGNKKLQMYTSDSYTKGASVYVVLEYTKTTDIATTGIPSTTALMESYDEGVNEA